MAVNLPDTTKASLQVIGTGSWPRPSLFGEKATRAPVAAQMRQAEWAYLGETKRACNLVVVGKVVGSDRYDQAKVTLL